ncbi:MAG TPA: hypothetical protein VMM13_06360 [Euzebya sp.]|nr:hypothetical protein [Euzebya sp.]
MSDFSDALQERLTANADLARQRAAAEEEMDRERREAEAAAAQQDQSQREQHALLAAHVADLADRLKASRPDSFIVRTGWTESGEEYIAKMTTRQMSPKRSLFIEVDRDDDEILARWTSEIGNAIEIWRLMDVTPAMLTLLVLQVADDSAWTGRRPPPFPTM